jgi:hypothetical protein
MNREFDRLNYIIEVIIFFNVFFVPQFKKKIQFLLLLLMIFFLAKKKRQDTSVYDMNHEFDRLSYIIEAIIFFNVFFVPQFKKNIISPVVINDLFFYFT